MRGAWWSIVLLTVLPISGCAGLAGEAGSPSDSVSQSASATPLPEQVTATFRGIARASCDRANSEGVVEVTTGPREFRQVLVPPEQAYKDYRGAFYSAPDTYELVLETGGFAACSAAESFTGFDEGYDTELKVTYDPATGSYTTQQDLGDLGVQEFRYKVADGVIVSAMRTAEDGEYDTVLTYGAVSEADIAIIKTAVDRF